MHISKVIIQNIIKIANYQTFSKLAVKHHLPPPFTCKPLKVSNNFLTFPISCSTKYDLLNNSWTKVFEIYIAN